MSKVIHEAELRYQVEGRDDPDGSWSFLCASETRADAVISADYRAETWKQVRVIDTHETESETE
ncbi:hypothetical protein ACSHWG_01055 [Leucobacter sp. Z1108]|uniref:hypothetical protein n=1 Tax=Leucobacter sp. Z1108 TaxID=3439066 RepID=UPI003F3D8F57